MKTNQTLKKHKRKLWILSCIVILLFGTFLGIKLKEFSHVNIPFSLNLEIEPKNAEVSVGQNATFWAIIHNGTQPYEIEWYCNDTYIGSGVSINFIPFTEPTNLTTLMVHVTDSTGNYGWATTSIYDPASINIYLDDLPATAKYVVKSDGTNYWYVGDDGKKMAEGTNASRIINWALGNLTSGRTWKEVVKLKGSFTWDGTVQVPNYTALDLTGAKITLEGNCVSIPDNRGMVENSDIVNGNKMIDIIGGEWYFGTQVRSIRGIKIMNAWKFSITKGSFFNWQRGSGSTTANFAVEIGGAGIYAKFWRIADNYFENCREAGFTTLPWAMYGVVERNIAKDCQYGIYPDTMMESTIANNVLIFTGTPGSTDRGIRLYRYCRNLIISGNIISGFYTGIKVEPNQYANNRFIGNILYGNTVQVSNGDPDTTAFWNNQGYNPVGYVSPDPTWGTSPWTFTNNYGYPTDNYISGGTISDIAKGGQSLGITSGLIHLEPWESIVITYSVAGTIKVFGQ